MYCMIYHKWVWLRISGFNMFVQVSRLLQPVQGQLGDVTALLFCSLYSVIEITRIDTFIGYVN